MDPPEERSDPLHNDDGDDDDDDKSGSTGSKRRGCVPHKRAAMSDHSGDVQDREEAAIMTNRSEDGQDTGADEAGAPYLIGVRRALQEDFDRHVLMRRGRDGDDNDSNSNDDDYDYLDPYRHFDDDYGEEDDDDGEEDHDVASGDGFRSMLELEEMERSLDYHDYLDREIDAYLEEPMRQLMREMEKEMDVSYLDDVNNEDDYYVDRYRHPEVSRNQADSDRAFPVLESADLQRNRDASSDGASSTYASVQASIQHAIFCYKNGALASSER
jgi:hypothetical protein